MKVLISNPCGIVQAATLVKHTGAFSVYINTQYKWIEPNYTECTHDSYSWGYTHPTDDTKEDRVTIVAETEEEKWMASYMNFKTLCGNELHVLFVPYQTFQVDNSTAVIVGEIV